MVVDDDPTLREFLKTVLEKFAHCRAVGVATSELALRVADRRKVDVVISDLVRPGMDGFDFLKTFKLAYPDTPVIIFSGQVAGARERRAYRLGAFSCLLKPATHNEILRVVNETVAHAVS